MEVAFAGPGKIKGRAATSQKNFIASPAGLSFFDSMAVEADGTVCVATIMNGGISRIHPETGDIRHVPTDDPMTTNICFGGADLKTAYITASGTGRLLKTEWDTPGTPLNFLESLISNSSAETPAARQLVRNGDCLAHRPVIAFRHTAPSRRAVRRTRADKIPHHPDRSNSDRLFSLQTFSPPARPSNALQQPCRHNVHGSGRAAFFFFGGYRCAALIGRLHLGIQRQRRQMRQAQAFGQCRAAFAKGRSLLPSGASR